MRKFLYGIWNFLKAIMKNTKTTNTTSITNPNRAERNSRTSYDSKYSGHRRYTKAPAIM